MREQLTELTEFDIGFRSRKLTIYGSLELSDELSRIVRSVPGEGFYVPATGQTVDQVVIAPQYNALTKKAFLNGLVEGTALDDNLTKINIENYLAGERLGFNPDKSIGATYKCSQVVLAGLGLFYRCGKQDFGHGDVPQLVPVNKLVSALSLAWNFGHSQHVVNLSDSIRTFNS